MDIMQKRLSALVIVLLGVTWLSHLVQVFTPEVGFDAVWYHLPVIRAVVEAGRLVYLPELYQSLNPLLSDLIFGLGFVVGGELGAKIVAYLFGLLLILATYRLSRQFLNHFWSLAVVLVISSFQVVAWQSASFYVDLAKASWEILSLLCLIKWHRSQRRLHLFLAALLFGASLSTKLFSLLLLPIFLLLVRWWSNKSAGKQGLIFTFSSLLPPLPFYIFTWQQAGNPFLALSWHLKELGRIGAGASLGSHWWQRSLSLPLLPGKLIFARDYTSLILVVFLPILIWFLFKSKQKLIRGLSWFTLGQLMIWWYLPPPSTRYALSGFIVWALLSIIAARFLIQHQPRFRLPLIVTILLTVIINLAPRFYVNYRSWLYLSGQQSKETYIHQFFDGNIDPHLRKWHHLN